MLVRCRETETEIWERISSGSEMHTCSYYITTFTYVPVASLGSSNTKDKNNCASKGSLGASQCVSVNILLKNAPNCCMSGNLRSYNKD